MFKLIIKVFIRLFKFILFVSLIYKNFKILKNFNKFLLYLIFFHIFPLKREKKFNSKRGKKNNTIQFGTKEIIYIYIYIYKQNSSKFYKFLNPYKKKQETNKINSTKHIRLFYKVETIFYFSRMFFFFTSNLHYGTQKLIY